MLDISDIAPDFILPDSDSAKVSLASLKPAIIVLFFYPRDDTSGCTIEAIAFSQLLEDFKAAGAVVYGISKDTVASHIKFRAKKELTVQLLSDAETNVCEEYGVWKEKKLYGKTFMGIERATFLINADGNIAKVWRKVKVAGHAEAVLDAVRAL